MTIEINLLEWKHTQDMFDIKKTSDHNLKAKVVGKDPFFVSPPLQLEVSSSVNQHIIVRMKVTNHDDITPNMNLYACVYYQFEGMKEFNESYCQSSLIITDGKFCDYHFKIFSIYPTIIKRLRFDPINHPCLIEVSSFRIQKYQKYEVSNISHFKFPKVAIVESHGRTGSTILMKLLSLHKNITCIKDSPCEAYILIYFMKIYNLIRYSPHVDTYERLLAIIKPVTEGGALPCPAVFQRGLDIDIFREEYRKFLASYLPKLFYTLGMENLETSHYYIEKQNSYGDIDAAIDVFPDTKVLSLFRDPRSVLLSVVDFERKTRQKLLSIGCPNRAALIRRIMEKVRHQISRLDNLSFSNQSLSIRYEDIISRTTFTMEEVCRFLDIPCDGNYLTRVVEHLHKDTQEYRQHRTTKNLEHSLYRYKSELSDSDKEVFAEYKDVFERLNYELE